MNKNILLLLLLIGLSMIIISLTTEKIRQNIQPIIKYRYIPRTFEEEQNNQPFVTDIFAKMFTENSPWITDIYYYDYDKQEKINKTIFLTRDNHHTTSKNIFFQIIFIDFSLFLPSISVGNSDTINVDLFDRTKLEKFRSNYKKKN